MYTAETHTMCYVCNKFVPPNHDCEVAKRLAEHPVDLVTPFLTAKAVPTVKGPDQAVT